MARPTLEQYLTYMKGAPRTRGWGALLVYDRQKANLLLMQEHIQRAAEKAWIEPVSGEKETESGKLSRLSNFTFGAPVLSFENSNIGSSMAVLRMPVVGGKLTEWSRQPGESLPTLVGISHLDPLTAPSVKMNIKLNEGQGGVVDEDGRVYLDLSDSSAYDFEVSQWEELNTKLGELIEAQFKSPERGKQIWELNRLEPVDGFLNPTSFRVRTHSLARAGNPEASTNQADLEEGAVIIGVAFNGAQNGDFPGGDEDMPYLLPQRESGVPYSMNVVLSDETWVKNVLNSLLEGLADTSYVPTGVTYERNERGFHVSAKTGEIHINKTFVIVDREKSKLLFLVGVNLGQFTISFTPGYIDCVRRCENADRSVSVLYKKEGDFWKGTEGDLDLDAVVSCALTTSMNDGVIMLSKGDVSIDCNWWADVGTFFPKEVAERLIDFQEEVKGHFGGVLESLAGELEVVDLLRLNGLLFRNGQRSVAETFASPGDVTMLGELAPILTAFAIDPIEKSLIAGGTQKLTLIPEPQPGDEVKWEVKALPGDPENPEGPEQLGEIVNGIYKAPKADAIAGTFRQVIITATVGDSSSSALFTVVPKSVAVRPKLLNALFSTPGQPQRYVLEGGSVESDLVWAKGAGFKGDLRDPTSGEYEELNIPRDKKVQVYVAPESDPEDGGELGALMQLDQVLVTGGNRTEIIDITVLWKPTAATLKVEAQGEALKLVLVTQKWGEPPKELPPAETKWFVVKGEGALDEAAGIYNPGSEEGDYVIIAGVGLDSGNWNYAVLPMPYTPEEAQAFHEVNQAIKGTNASAPYSEEQIKAMEEVKKAFSNLNAARI
ncbi:hypothetical protein ACIPW4_14800 [Pseudomonas sp. NPDC089996]|uniref:hypothetical protein n=1 Tax=Pseudomonas sp. NPDC089996 TaxID=3364474 RepID=UPI00380AAF8F